MGCNGLCPRHLAAIETECQHTVFLVNFPKTRIMSRTRRKERVQMDVSETEMMLKGYGLTTAEFFYRMPDYRNVLNSYVWQDYDLAPDYPMLFKFIEFWQDEIEGELHSVRYAHRKLISPGEWRSVVGELTYH